MKNIPRIIPLNSILKKKSVLLVGPRRTGKSYLIRNQIKPDLYYDLLRPETFRKLSSRPEVIQEEAKSARALIAIDEIQKLPSLMDYVHSLIETTDFKFLITGSSAKKLKRNYTSLMAGRAKKIIIHPLVYPEIENYDLSFILKYGTLPIVINSDDPWGELRDYAGLYLQEEIQAEAFVRKIENYSRFLDVASLMNGQLLNYEKIAQDAQVPARTIREYYALLEDTLMGRMITPIKKTTNRKSISSGKFYFFDIGVTNSIQGRKDLTPKTKEFGFAFEHLIALELFALKDYQNPDLKINFWRIDEENEVDFVLNDDIAIEVKTTELVTEKHLKGITKFANTGKCSRKIVVSLDQNERRIQGIEIMPFKIFLDKLWKNKIISINS